MQHQGYLGGRPGLSFLSEKTFRIGTGYDFHVFEEDRKLVLGGVTIPYPLGLKGHSDADALLHAVSDALLGAAGLKDIGSYFSDTDAKYRNVASSLMLEKVYRLIRGEDFSVGNIDVTIITEQPQIRPHVEAIKNNLARILHLQTDEIGIKATSMEGRGCVGRGEGVAVQAVVLLVR